MARYQDIVGQTSLAEEAAAAYGALHQAEHEPFAFLDRIKQGIDSNTIKQLIDSYPLSSSDWAEISGIPFRSFARYLKEKKPITGIHAERILATLELILYGIDVLGSQERFFTWVERPRPNLNGMSPRELMPYAYGKELLMRRLARIEHGIY